MMDVQVVIDGILLYCDESASLITLGNGYTIQKTKVDDLPYRSHIVDGNGRLSINYMGSRIIDGEDVYFMCIHKNDTHKIQSPQVKLGAVITDRDLMCDEQLEAYKDNELSYLYKMFSLLRLFKQGNIGYKEIFLTHRFTVMGFMTNTMKQRSDSVTRNIVDTRVYSLTPNEAKQCNSFVQSYSGKEYDLLKECIDEFVWGLEQTDAPTAFEQYTTALEMIFLAKNQQNKKQVLSKRVAVLLGTTDADVESLYKKMLSFYRYRSESLHEGKGSHITATEMYELEEITRRILYKYLEFCKVSLSHRPDAVWKDIKSAKISDLRKEVASAIKRGVLPKDQNSFLQKVRVFLSGIIKN